MTKVVITRKAEKDLSKIPFYIADKLDKWIELVETEGIREVRKVPGFHDEPLTGKRWGQRSIRLSRSYRAIYETKRQDQIEVISIEEVSKHAY